MAHQQGGGMKVAEVQRQVDDVKAVMQENVDVMLQNIDKTEVLEAKADSTQQSAELRRRRHRAATARLAPRHAALSSHRRPQA
jgi:hypothetical protein